MHSRTTILARHAVASMVSVALVLTGAAPAHAAPPPATPPPVAIGDLFGTGPVTLTSPGYFGWALLNRATGKLIGSSTMASTSTTASMIKAWLVADYLRRADEAGRTPGPAWLHRLTIAIIDSDNTAATTTYTANGGAASIRRLISICGLTDSSPGASSWSKTAVSPRDAVRMGACLADGRGAGPRWTTWLITTMHAVRGVGRFGIIDAMPADIAPVTAIKNGWLLRDEDHLWYVNCLAMVGNSWVLAVMTRYRGSLGFDHGRLVCRDVALQLLAHAPVLP